MKRSALLVCAALALSPCASVNAAPEPPPRVISSAVWSSEHFQRAHPDLRHRLAGQAHFEDGRLAQAVDEFVQAAGFGDKLAQAMLAEMHWQGQGLRVDRARAYAWMDLAAERGFVSFLAMRERYWAALNAKERSDALAIGADLYPRFGDAVALRRLAWQFNKARQGSVAMRPGMGGRRGVVVFPVADTTSGRTGLLGSNGAISLDFASYYAAEFWRVDRYLRWHAQQLELARRGRVEIGPVSDRAPL